MSEFELTTDGETIVGPVSMDQIRRGIESGQIPADARARQVGTQEWLALSVVPSVADPFQARQKKYSAAFAIVDNLRTAGVVYKVLGWIVSLAAVAGGLWSLSSSGATALMMMLGGIVCGSVLGGIGLLFLALGETLSAVLDTAVSSRVAADRLAG